MMRGSNLRHLSLVLILSASSASACKEDAPKLCKAGNDGVYFTNEDGEVTDLTSRFSQDTYGHWYALEDGTVTFCEGEWRGYIIANDRSLTIEGTGNPEDTILDAGSMSYQPVITSQRSDLTVQGMTLTGGTGLKIEECGDYEIHHDLYATRDCGGGLYFQGGELLVEDVLFYDNDAIRGGGMYLLRATGAVNDSSFINNKGHYDGGGISLEQSTLLLNGVTIKSNESGRGGGIAITKSHVTISDSWVFEHRDGGARLFSGTLCSERSDWWENTAGDVIDPNSDALTIPDNDIWTCDVDGCTTTSSCAQPSK